MRKLSFLLLILVVTLISVNAWAAGVYSYLPVESDDLEWTVIDLGDPDGVWEIVEPSYFPPAFPSFVNGDCRLVRAESDYDGDGCYDEDTFTYDASGNMIKMERDFCFYNGDGIDQASIYTYDANGYLITIAVDSDNDTYVDSVLTFIYDEDGRLITIEIDSDNDEVKDATQTFIYDEDGRLITI